MIVPILLWTITISVTLDNFVDVVVVVLLLRVKYVTFCGLEKFHAFVSLHLKREKPVVNRRVISTETRWILGERDTNKRQPSFFICNT